MRACFGAKFAFASSLLIACRFHLARAATEALFVEVTVFINVSQAQSSRCNIVAFPTSQFLGPLSCMRWTTLLHCIYVLPKRSLLCNAQFSWAQSVVRWGRLLFLVNCDQPNISTLFENTHLEDISVSSSSAFGIVKIQQVCVVCAISGAFN